jgi:hypothetical protein
MKFYYDLACCPPTYDIVSAVQRAEFERRQSGDDAVQFVFLPGPAGGFRADPLWPFTVAERQRMLRHVAMPIVMLLPNVSVTLAVERPTHGLGVGKRLYGLSEQVHASRHGIRPLRAPSPVLVKANRITMTLREAEHWPTRNSRVAQWAAAAERLIREGYEVIVVRDTRKAEEPLDDLPTLPAAARNIFVRADLYASAGLNVFLSNGPAWLAVAMDVPTLVFKRPSDADLGVAFGRSHFDRCGMPWGGQMPGSPPYQTIVWQDDTADDIVSAVTARMAAKAAA